MRRYGESHGSRFLAVGEVSYKYGNREDENGPLGIGQELEVTI